LRTINLRGVESKGIGTHFIVALKRKSDTGEEYPVLGTTQKATQKTRGKAREETREKILRLIRDVPIITTAELAEKVGLSPKGIEWNLNKMKKEGLVRRIGPDKGACPSLRQAGAGDLWRGHWERCRRREMKFRRSLVNACLNSTKICNL